MPKSILIIGLVYLLSGQEGTKFYNLAIPKIIESSAYQCMNGSSKKYFVSPEVLNFDNRAIFFQKELLANGSTVRFNYNLSNKEIVFLNSEMTKLGTRRRAETKLYFSQIKDGFFFCEVIMFEKSKSKYEQKPAFGRSYVYLFRINDSDINILDVTEFLYN